MASPRIRFYLRDPGDIAAAIENEQLPFFLGTSSTGSVAVAKSFGSLEDVETEYTMGTLVDIAALFFALGGTTFRCLRLTSSVAGALRGSIAQSGTGADLLLTNSVHHHDTQVKVEALSTGDVDTGTQLIRYTLADWTIEGIQPTYSEPVTLPASGIYPIPNTGIILNFNDAEAMAEGETYTFATDAPYYTATEVAVATPILQTPAAGDFTCLVYCGDHATDAAAANTVGVAIEAQCLALFNAFKFTGFAHGGSKDATPADVVTNTVSTAYDPPFGTVGYGGFYVVNPRPEIGRAIMRIREHEVFALLLPAMKISTDPARVASGALPLVVGLDYDKRTQGDSLHDARISIGRTFNPPAQEGVFINRQRLLSASNSDFTTWPHAAVMIAALRAMYPVVNLYLVEGLRQTATSTMDPRDIALMREDCNRALTAALVTPDNVRGIQGHVSEASATISATVQLPAVGGTIRIRPLNYATDIEFTFMFAGEV